MLGKGALATGAARKKAIVAVARQLALDLWRIRTGRVNPQTLGLLLKARSRDAFEGNRKEPNQELTRL